ncbi:hypothetical protein ACM0P6_09600 [Komagataeibacter sucrofermentans]|uniref:hypothetical protein n=1 Tax=Komagataeibacter sucrofermentans TaxID=1053551 RepID=UPI0011B52EF6|nr:hypothetical protein [Komagataeibacter sucrofermentans]
MNRLSLLQKHPYLLAGGMGVLCGGVNVLLEPENPFIKAFDSPQMQHTLQHLSGILGAEGVMALVLLIGLIAGGLINLAGNAACMSLPYWLIGRLSRLQAWQKNGVFFIVAMGLQGALTYWQWGYSNATDLGLEVLEMLSMTVAYLMPVRHRLLLSVYCGMMTCVVLFSFYCIEAMPTLRAQMHPVETAQPLPGGLAPDGRHHVAHEVEQDL